MQPELPQPQPVMPNTQPGANNPYGFITDPGAGFQIPPKKSRPKLLSNKILLIAAGILVIFIVILLIVSALSNNKNQGTQKLVDLVAQQTEIQRVSALGLEKTRSSTAKNLAATTSLSLKTLQRDTAQLLKAKAVPALTVAQKGALKSKKTDDALLVADQNNTYDSAFVAIMLANLANNQSTLKQAVDAATTKTEKSALKQQYDYVTLIIDSQKK